MFLPFGSADIVPPSEPVSRFPEKGRQCLNLLQRTIYEQPCIVFPHKKRIIARGVCTDEPIPFLCSQRTKRCDRSAEVQVAVMGLDTVEVAGIRRAERVHIAEDSIVFNDADDGVNGMNGF